MSRQLVGASRPATDAELDGMFAAELPPCELMLNGGPRCNTPSVALVKFRCLGCRDARQSPLCGPCRDLVLEQANLCCQDCGGTIVIRGQS